MINQVAAEAMYSATYVENYLDSVENLPNDVQRHLTRIREIDLQYRVHLKDVDYYYDQWSNCSTNDLESNNATSKRARAMNRIQQSLIAAQELGDEKMQVVTQLQEIIDLKTRQLDSDFKNLDYGARDDQSLAATSPKDVPPLSPTAAVPSTSNHIKAEIKTEEGATASAAVPVPVTTSERINVVAASTTSGASQPTNSNNGGDRSWKRSRRGRNDVVSARGNGSNSFAASNKGSSAMEIGNETSTIVTPTTKATTSGQATSQATVGGSSSSTAQSKKQTSTGKKKKRKSGRAQGVAASNTNANTSTGSHQGSSRPHDDTPPLEETIDPDEPTYCLCDQISFGEMILCDNDLCPIEWFHFSCVSLTTKPKGKWFCPNCRGDKPSVMKPKQQFLKELERYNREKEEKT